MDRSLFDTLPDTSGAANFSIEKILYSQGLMAVAGCDEVGRGPLAGPVVAASVILPQDCNPAIFLDSKKISHKRRTELFVLLHELNAVIGVGIVDEKKIDQINILQASLLAMKIAVEELATKGTAPDYVLVDGKFEIPHPVSQQALIKGESKSASIAAASIIAKITRDRIMDDFHKKYPVYQFHKHKGYPTKAHREAIAQHGPCPIHRRSFKGVKK